MLEQYKQTNLLMEQNDVGTIRTSVILNGDSVLESYMEKNTGIIETKVTPIEQYIYEEGYGYNDEGAWDNQRSVAKEILPKGTNISKVIFSDEIFNVSILSSGHMVITTQDGMYLLKL